MRRAALLVLSLLFGLMAAGIFARTLLLGVDRGEEPVAGLLFAREGWLWEGATDAATGLRWVNLERRWHRSNDPALRLGDLPAWAEPPAGLPAPRGTSWRIATLAVGWPWPMLARQWRVEDDAPGFPPHPPLDDDGLTLEVAARRFLAPDPTAVWRPLPVGIALDAIVFAVPFAGLLWLGARRRAGRHSAGSRGSST